MEAADTTFVTDASSGIWELYVCGGTSGTEGE
jgi:hypothetical protein